MGMSGPRITIEYDVSEFRGRFSVDAEDFEGMTPEQIEKEVRSQVSEFAAANVSFHPENLPETVKAIQAGVAGVAKARQDELVEGFEAGDFGDVEFTELALAAGMDVAAIENALQAQREGAL